MDKEMFQGQLTRSSLGRLGLIGELYDVRTESFSSRSLLKSSFPSEFIKCQDMKRMEFDYKFTENISDRCEILNIEAELQLSVLLGFINLEGSGRFLSEEKKSGKTISCSLICKLLNVSEKLFGSFEEILQHIDLTSLNDPQYTHVIAEINWGANCLLTLESSFSSSNEKEQLEGEMSAELSKLKVLLSTSGSGMLNKENLTLLNNNTMNIKICADVVSENGWPTTVEGFCQFVLEIPKLLKNINDGKGKPLNYVMIPLDTIRKLANLESSIDVTVKKIDESFLMSTIYFFEEISQIKRKFNDVLDKMTANKGYMTNEDLKKTKQQFENLLIKESEMKSLISGDWVLVKSGKKDLKDLIRKIEKFKNHDLNLLTYENFLDSCDLILNRLSVVNNYKSRGVIYLGKGDKLHATMAEYLSYEFIVLVISSEIEKNYPELYRNTTHYFLTLATEPQPKTKYIVVDFDLNPEEELFGKKITEPKCYHLKGDKILNSDLYAKYCEELDKNYARLGNGVLTEYVNHKPSNRTMLEIRCPGFEAGSCPPKSLNWYCSRCKNFLEYGFDEYYYCFCGKGPARSFEYRCSNIKHGSFFIPFKPDLLVKALSTLRPLKELNVLILGQSGVGKSTWINSIVNYLTYESLNVAKEHGVINTIPMSFVMYDSHTLKKHVINVGNANHNEVTELGASATQYSHTYSFAWEGRLVRIIDTPGLGDTRGIIQDKENLQNIIEHIGYLKELHGVCILFKANDNRINAFFSYCLKELLAHLHKSVAKNIVFCFTNARNSLYSPGQTSAILEKVIESLGIKKDLALGRHNMFCLDNEALLFLCSLQFSDIQYDESLVKSFAQSWEISLNETKRLFNTIKTFEPHLLKETISLVTARNRVLSLTKPLAEISKTIQLNVAAIERKKKEITDSELAIDELSKKLNMTQIELEVAPLAQPRTVCTNLTCIEYIYYTSLDVSEIEYKTHCHVECYLKNVTPKTVNNYMLENCKAMSNGSCKVCGCDWRSHMHITVSQHRVEKTVVNKVVEMDMLKQKSEKEQVENFVKSLEDTQKKFQEEQEFIIQACVKFGMFLRQNAISLYNDSVEEYLNYLIQTEESKLYKSKTEEALLQTLKDTLEHYKAEVRIIEEIIRKGENAREELTVQDVCDLEQQLYNLPLTGKTIKESVLINRSTNKKVTDFAVTPVQLIKNSKKNVSKEAKKENCTKEKKKSENIQQPSPRGYSAVYSYASKYFNLKDFF